MEKSNLDKKISDCFASCRYEEALKHCKESLKRAVETEDKNWEIKAYNSLAVVLNSLARFQEAIKYCKMCLPIAIQMKNRNAEARVYENLANALQRSGLPNDSIEYCKNALTIAVDSDDQAGQQQAYLLLGNAYKALGKYEESMKYLKKCLELAIKTSDRHMQGRAYGNMGVVLKAQGKYHEAIENHKKYRDISIEMNSRQGEANAYGNLGIAYRLLGKYYQAIRCHEKNISIAREIGDKKGEGNAIGSMGNAYKALGKYQEAIDCYEKGLAIAREIKSKDGELNAYGQLGSVYQELKEFKKAIQNNEKCLEITIQIGDRNGEAKAYGHLGSNYQGLKDYEKAIKYQTKFLKIATELGDKNGQMVSYGELGHVYLLLGKYEKAIGCAQQSLDLARAMEDRSGQGKACDLFALCYYKLSYVEIAVPNGKDRLSSLREAEKYLKESIESYDWIFDNLEEQDQFKISIVDTFVHAYKLLTMVYIETQQIKEALLACEQGKARALGDLLKTKYKVQINAGPRKNLELCEVKRVLSVPGSCILFYGILAQSHEQADVAVKGCVASWIITQDSLTLDTPRTELHKVELSSEIPTDKHVSSLVHQVFRDMKEKEVLHCEDRSLETNLDMRCIEDVQYDGDPLEKLFDMFVAPVQDQLTQEEIVIIPDGELFTVPYAALKDPKTKSYFFENKRIRLAPSLTTLTILKGSSADYHKTAGALIVGNPDVGRVIFHEKVETFCRLTGAELEAKEIADMLGIQAITGPEATKEAIKGRLREGVTVVHFAAHGSTEGEIALTPNTRKGEGSIPKEEDYLLTMKEVQEIGIKAQLVVLSCCHSGGGDIKAEGVVGMSRAFLAAGARAVVGSLWAIADEATRVFMGKFYTQLKQEKSASESLLRAMQGMRAMNEYKDPKFWAPFFLIGDDVTLNL